jgi:hypothetical protein
MVTQKLKLLNSTRAKVAKLERIVAVELSRELAALPRKYGFASVQHFITALRNSVDRKMVSAGNKLPGNHNGHDGRKPRASITVDTKAKVKRLVATGKTGIEIAKALNVSVPSVYNIKKELGLLRRRRLVPPGFWTPRRISFTTGAWHDR